MSCIGCRRSGTGYLSNHVDQLILDGSGPGRLWQVPTDEYPNNQNQQRAHNVLSSWCGKSLLFVAILHLGRDGAYSEFVLALSTLESPPFFPGGEGLTFGGVFPKCGCGAFLSSGVEPA